MQAGLEPDTLYLLAESIFAYIDVLSGESAEGHAREQSVAAGEAQLYRRRLVRLLVREPPPEPAAIESAAREAGWTLPRSLAVLAIAGDHRDGAVSRLPPMPWPRRSASSPARSSPTPRAPGAALRCARGPRGARASGVGRRGGLAQAAVSLDRARAALALGGSQPGLVAARDRAGELLLRADPILAAELARDKLAPLQELSAGARGRFTQTLTVWLAEQGRPGAVATRMGIHPQTARYRIARLRDLFGSRSR